MKETTHDDALALARKLVLTHGDALVSEKTSWEDLYAADVAVWEEIDRICQLEGYDRSNFRTAVMALYGEMLEPLSGLQAA